MTEPRPRSNEAASAAEQLCAAELEAQDWRKRLLQAEEQLSLDRLQRRGEQHPRWPANSTQQQSLLGTHASLQASDLVSNVKEVLWDLVHAKTVLGQLEEDFAASSEEVQCCRKEAAKHRADASELMEGRAAEDARLAQRELQISLDKDRAKELARLLQESFNLENELAEQVALGQDAMEVVHRKVQDFLPSQQKMQEEAQKAAQECNRFRTMAQRRKEAVTQTQEEVDQVERSGLEEQAALEQRLEQMREEVSEMAAKTTELGDQQRKAHVTHTKQIKAVKEGGSALRDALSEVGQEKEDLEVELERLRSIVESASLAHGERRSRQEAQEAVNEALEEELRCAQDSLDLAEVAHTEATGSRSGTVKAGLVKAKETLSKAQEAAQTAAREAQEALQQLEELRSEKHRLTGETGVEAEKRRAQLKEALQKELAQLKSEVESSEAECQKINRRMDWHRQLKEQQQFARCAAKEAAATLRGVYGDLSRGKSAKPSDTATGQKARRLSKHLDDFLRFLAEAVALAEDKNAVPKSATNITNLNLPLALKEAYVAKLGQSEDNSGPVQQLDATKEKLKVVRSELQEAQEGHESEAERLQEDCEDLRQRILEGQEQLQEEKRKSEEAKQRLCQGITEAGCRRNEAQMQAVARVQKELANHEREMALLRQERDALQARLAGKISVAVPLVGDSPAGASRSSSPQKCPKAWHESYSHLADTRAPDVVEEPGSGRPETQRPRTTSPPLTRPASTARSLLRPVKSAVAFRDSEDVASPGPLDFRAEGAQPSTEGVHEPERPAAGSNLASARLLVPSPCTATGSSLAGATENESPLRASTELSDILPHRQSGLEPTQASSRTPSVASGLRPVTSPLEGGPTSPVESIGKAELSKPRLPEAEAGAAGGPVALPAVPREVASTPSPSRSSPAALSTPWGEMEAAVEPSPKSGPTPKSGKSGPSPKSGFELGSPSRLPETLAEQRQQDMEAPVAPEFNEAETPLLRLEPAPCGSEIRTVAQTYEDQQLAEPSSPLRRSPIPALSMSWAEMEAAALEPTPKCSDVVSPSYPSEGMASPGASSRTGRSEAFRQGFEAAPQWEPVAPVRQRSPSPVYCIASPPISPSLPWSVPLQVQMPLIQQPVRMVQQVVQQVVQVPLQPIQSPVPNAARPVPVPQAMQGLPTVQATPSPSQCSSRPSQPMYRLSRPLEDSRSRSPSPEVPVTMRWGIIGTEALSPRLRPEAPRPKPQPDVEHVWVDDPMVSLRDQSYVTGSPVSSESIRCDPWSGRANSPMSPEYSPSQESTPHQQGRPLLRRPNDSRQSSPQQASRSVQAERPPDPDFASPEWANRALEGEKWVLPEPQLPPLEDLFAKNMLEQTTRRKLQKQRERMQRAIKEPPAEPPEAFFTSIVKL